MDINEIGELCFGMVCIHFRILSHMLSLAFHIRQRRKLIGYLLIRLRQRAMTVCVVVKICIFNNMIFER